eukprot:364480-Chlamydomonas_euryale.AAC.12
MTLSACGILQPGRADVPKLCGVIQLLHVSWIVASKFQDTLSALVQTAAVRRRLWDTSPTQSAGLSPPPVTRQRHDDNSYVIRRIQMAGADSARVQGCHQGRDAAPGSVDSQARTVILEHQEQQQQ